MKRFSKISRAVTLAGTGLFLLGPVPVLAKQFKVTNTKDSGEGSLRRAIEDANEVSGDDEIAFNIPGKGVHIISVLSDLPTITDTVTIDGTTQPGYNKTPLIRIDGKDTRLVGLRFMSARGVLKGLIITRFFVGLSLEGDGEHTVTGCFIGTDALGRMALGNGTGILVGSPYNLIGGVGEGERNLISGNRGEGIRVTRPDAESGTSGADSNLIFGSFIGTDVGGVAPLGNGGSGIVIDGVNGSGISSNVIAGNGEHGVLIENGARATSILANSIGTNSSGEIPLGNAKTGVYIEGSSDTWVGLTEAGQGNRIAYNSGSGVTIVGTASQRNTVRGNASGSNLGNSRGIDLGGDGITANDTQDVDMGPNTFQNTPGVATAVNSSDSTTIVVGMNSTPGKTFIIDLYVSPQCDASLEAELQKRWLTSKEVKTDERYGNGIVTFLTGSPLPVGAGVTAVATDAAGNTSEYSLCNRVR